MGELLMTPFLLIRVYFCCIGSYHMISPAEEPIITSKWLVLFVNSFTSWQSMCAFVKKIFVIAACFALELRSSHWNERFILANAYTPSGLLSANFFVKIS